MVLFRVIKLYDLKNTLSFPSEETSLGSGLPSHLPQEMHHARPALLTVFSITQSDHSITLLNIRDVTDLEIHLNIGEYRIFKLIFKFYEKLKCFSEKR